MTEAELKQLGFKRKWLSDRSGYWMELKIDSFINGCHICVEDGRYSLWAKDIENKTHVYLGKGKVSKKVLEKLIKKITK